MRRDARITAFTLIFEKLFTSCDEFDSELIDNMSKLEDRQFARDLISSFEENRESLTEIISKYLTGYSIDRVYKIDLALIYTALCEIKYQNVPKQVAINEAVEIAKVYSTEKSPKFIHGVLSSIIKGEEL